MPKARGVLAALVLALILGVSAGSALAADAKAAGPQFGTVDVERAFNEYEKKKQLDEQLMTSAEQARQKLELRSTNRLLTADEFKQLADLRTKPKQDDADKKKIDEILALSKQREQELQTLQQKQDSTDAEKARLKELQDQLNGSDASLKEDTSKYQTELRTQQVDLSRQVMQEVEVAVAAIAKDKGLSLVFNKSAGEPGLVIYSSMDITDEVLKRLNKK